MQSPKPDLARGQVRAVAVKEKAFKIQGIFLMPKVVVVVNQEYLIHGVVLFYDRIK